VLWHNYARNSFQNLFGRPGGSGVSGGGEAAATMEGNVIGVRLRCCGCSETYRKLRDLTTPHELVEFQEAVSRPCSCTRAPRCLTTSRFLERSDSLTAEPLICRKTVLRNSFASP
jgi:hypothetical protein